MLKGARAISDPIQIIHSSQPFGYAAHSLGGILLDARRCTTRDDITGALVCRHDIYLQLLEGPADKVQAAFERILRDDRHIDMTKLMSEPVTERLFADWAMLHDPAKSVAWSEADISEAVLDRATHAEVKSVFEKLAVKVRDAALSA